MTYTTDQIKDFTAATANQLANDGNAGATAIALDFIHSIMTDENTTYTDRAALRAYANHARDLEESKARYEGRNTSTDNLAASLNQLAASL